MKYKNLETLVEILKKIKLPSSPQKRMVILQTVSELENQASAYTSLKKTYETEDLITLENDKYDFVKQHESSSGVEIYKIKVSDEHIQTVKEYIRKKNQEQVYQEYIGFVEFSETPAPIKELLKINDLPDDVFENLSTTEIEMLSEIIE